MLVSVVLMGFGGTSQPCAQVHLASAGKLGKEENKRISQGIAAFMQTHLGSAFGQVGGGCVYPCSYVDWRVPGCCAVSRLRVVLVQVLLQIH